MTTQRQTVLITGASSGIGEALARVFAREGHSLILTARREDLLNALAAQLTQQYGVVVTVIVQDLVTPGAVEQLVAALAERALVVDILVNNAGFGYYGPFAAMPESTITEMMTLNMVRLAELTRLLLGPMIVRGHGKILNVASTAAFQPGPGMALYFATKAFVLHLSEAINHELQHDRRLRGVSVTALCPGPTRTGFLKHAAVERSLVFSEKLFPLMGSEAVAEQGYRGLMAGKPIIITGWTNRLGPLIARFVPRSWLVWLVGQAQREV